MTHCLSVPIILSAAHFRGPQNIVLPLSAASLPGKLLEMKIPIPYPTTDSEIWGWCLVICVLINLPGASFWCLLKCENHWNFWYSRKLTQLAKGSTDIVSVGIPTVEYYTGFVVIVQLPSCPTLCNPMDCSTPGSPVLHCLPEFAQIHVHWVGDAI